MRDTRVETIARLAQWKIENFGPTVSYKTSDPFKIGMWKWQLSVEKSKSVYIRFYPEPSRLIKDHPPFARFIIRVIIPGRKPYISPTHERLFRIGDDFAFPIDANSQGRFVIDVEFLDLKICPLDGGEASSVWPYECTVRNLATQSTLKCLSHVLNESHLTDITINTADGELYAHRAILSASSLVFHNMFMHDLKEKESSTINIEDMTSETCSALLSYIYGTINHDDFWKNRVSLLAAANKYDITGLKDVCEESLLDDINSVNVLDRLQEAWLYQLDKLKKGCLTYLLDFGRIYDVREEMNEFFRKADRELVVEMLQEVLAVWKLV